MTFLKYTMLRGICFSSIKSPFDKQTVQNPAKQKFGKKEHKNEQDGYRCIVLYIL